MDVLDLTQRIKLSVMFNLETFISLVQYLLKILLATLNGCFFILKLIVKIMGGDDNSECK